MTGWQARLATCQWLEVIQACEVCRCRNTELRRALRSYDKRRRLAQVDDEVHYWQFYSGNQRRISDHSVDSDAVFTHTHRQSTQNIWPQCRQWCCIHTHRQSTQNIWPQCRQWCCIHTHRQPTQNIWPQCRQIWLTVFIKLFKNKFKNIQ